MRCDPRRNECTRFSSACASASRLPTAPTPPGLGRSPRYRRHSMTQRVRETPSKVGQHRQAEATEAAWKSGDDVERAPSQRNAAMTDSAFDALVRDIDAWFAAPGKGYVPVKGFALVARGNSGKWTDAESRAYAALEGLKKLDDASLSLLRSFCWRGDKNRSSDAFRSARFRNNSKTTTPAEELLEQEGRAGANKVATNGKKKRRADDQPTRDDVLKKAKVADNITPPTDRCNELHGLRSDRARRDAFELKIGDELHGLRQELGRRDAFELKIRDEIHGLRQELGRRDAFELKIRDELHGLRQELGRRGAWMSASEVRDAASLDMARDEFCALRQDQICLAEHPTTQRVATAAAMQAVRPDGRDPGAAHLAVACAVDTSHAESTPASDPRGLQRPIGYVYPRRYHRAAHP
ncbi:hypothetical protein, variant [Saprolegnia diclina VS20]|uniref:Uncharacterized protein n=1 Tax=Saprolegnia diclina (strain VS20) TaxID=1156394 RepID=T0PTV4_SAPDV|nr:hypothetical protein, variant [Saprolegnia diclina VS20]EQC25666.1 hypothetical protein, variant [Saprolegnia diclina VS20]|eukprot:XP_008620885.1 hypothetical protein, variant [Saprolegnia diclina VS20]